MKRNGKCHSSASIKRRMVLAQKRMRKGFIRFIWNTANRGHLFAYWSSFWSKHCQPQLIKVNLVNCQVQDAIIIMVVPILL